jgi:cysteine-rich repeat protein
VVQDATSVSADVVAGQSVFVLIDGFEADDEAAFTLTVVSREANVCGDGASDELEECDDENSDAGDGCDPQCQVESNEAEPNDTAATAATISSPTYGRISPESDADYYLLSVVDGPRQVTINTYNLGQGWCSELLMDPQLELLSPTDGSLLASDDDGGEGFCAKLVATLPSGDYHIVVKNSADAAAGVHTTFPYQLGVSFQ